MKWYPFSVSKIIKQDWQDEDGYWHDGDPVADSQIGQPVAKPETKGLRRRREDLFDYPNAMAAWSGFVLASSRNEAEEKIDAAI